MPKEAGFGSAIFHRDRARRADAAAVPFADPATGADDPRAASWPNSTLGCLLPRQEQAEGVTGRVQHDPNAVAVAVRWLPWRLSAASLKRNGDRRFKVVDLDLEVQHL